MANSDNTGRALFQIVGSSTEDTNASFSLSSSDPSPIDPVHRALPTVLLADGPAPNTEDRRRFSPGLRGTGTAGTVRRPSAIEDTRPNRGRRRPRTDLIDGDDESDAMDDTVTTTRRLVVPALPTTAIPSGNGRQDPDGGNRSTVLILAPDGGD